MCLAELVLSTLIVTFRVTEDSKVQKRDYIKYAVYVKQEILDTRLEAPSRVLLPSLSNGNSFESYK